MIALGTNDAVQDIGFEEFRSTLQIFIKKLQLAFPSVEQFWVMASSPALHPALNSFRSVKL
ncbi:hypothetical protein C8J56DRAFT_1045238 [Mycena floridula]|nr:hypothetical protein C8J56DRAFT_1045238 [Mycena floridula]